MRQELRKSPVADTLKEAESPVMDRYFVECACGDPTCGGNCETVHPDTTPCEKHGCADLECCGVRMNTQESKPDMSDFPMIRSGKGKWHVYDAGVNHERSYISTLCGKTVFRRKPPIYTENIRPFNVTFVNCKNCAKKVKP